MTGHRLASLSRPPDRTEMPTYRLFCWPMLFLHRMPTTVASQNISNQYFTMPHVTFSLRVASRFLSLRNVFQGLVHWVLALRNLRAISSNLIPALAPPPPIPSLDAPTAFSGLRDELVLPCVSSVSAGSAASAVSSAAAVSSAFAVSSASAISSVSAVSSASAVSAASAISSASAELIANESQSPFLSSPISTFQSSLMPVTPNQLPDLFISIFVLLSIISAVILLGGFYFVTNAAKISSAFKRTSRIFARLFRTNPILYLVPACVPPVFSPFQLVICIVSLLILLTGPVRTHVSSHMTSLTQFVAHVSFAFHLGLDHVDPYQ